MADLDLRDTVSAGAPSVRKSGQTISPANHTIMQNVGTMKTYLLANGYIATTLFTMTRNDIVYATKLKLGIA